MTAESNAPTRTISNPDLSQLCTLGEEELAERLVWIEREIAPHAIRRLRLDDGVAWEYAPSIETRARLERLAELESDCCGPSGLDFRVRDAGGALRFEVRGEQAAALARALEEATGARSARRKKIARTAGLGAFGALALCCALPIGVAALFGAAIAAPLLVLDHPAAIGAVAAAIAVLLWRRQKAREVVAARGAPSCGC